MTDFTPQEHKFKYGLVPNIWPFGAGLLMSGIGRKDETGGFLILRALDDEGFEKGRKSGDPMDMDDWTRSGENGAPELLLSFEDVESVDSLINTLQKLQILMTEKETGN